MRENCNYIIVYSYRLGEDEEVVLGRRENHDRKPSFVTWMCNNKGNNYFWGHYFEDEVDALQDFVNRVKEEVGR